jgi:hypothetical protein
MKKSEYISLVLISAALASCDRQSRDLGDGEIPNGEKNTVYMRADTTEEYTPVNLYPFNNALWYYSFIPYGYYNDYNVFYYGYYNSHFNGCYNYNHHPAFYYNGPRHTRYYSNNGYGHGTFYGPHTTTGGFGHRSSSSGSVVS